MSWDGLGRWSTTYGRNGRLAFVELGAPCERSTYHYCPQRAEQAELRKRIKEIAETRVRYGAHSRAVAAGGLDPKRVYRLYRKMGLQLRNKTPKRRIKAQLRSDRATAVLGLGRRTWIERVPTRTREPLAIADLRTIFYLCKEGRVIVEGFG